MSGRRSGIPMIALGSLAALALAGGPAGGGGEAQGASAAALKQHERWYRIQVRFSGEVLTEHEAGFGGRIINESYEGSYVYDSARAKGSDDLAPTKVAARCAVNDRGALRRRLGPGTCKQWRARVLLLARTGRLSPRQAARALRLIRRGREAFSFNAPMYGRITDSDLTTIVGPLTILQTTGARVPCFPSDRTTTWTQGSYEQLGGGRVTSADRTRAGRTRRTDSSKGVLVESYAKGTSFYDQFQSFYSCPNSTPGGPLLRFASTDLTAQQTTWEPLDVAPYGHRTRRDVDGKPVERALAFTRPPGSFGRAFSVKRTIAEEANPARTVVDQLERRYTYEIIFKPCANGGRKRTPCPLVGGAG